MSQLKRTSLFTIISCCAILVLACSKETNTSSMDESIPSSKVETATISKDISRSTLKEMSAENRLLLDVRTVEEFQNGFILDAVNVPVDNLPEQVEYLSSLSADKSAPIVVYCRSGRRAQAAIDFLSSQGYSNLMHLEGDFGGWETANEEVTMPTN